LWWHEAFAVDPGAVSRVAAMEAEHIRGRLHDALHRGHRKATEEELGEVTAVVVAVVTELMAEMAEIIAGLAARVNALEAAAAR
jgi:hypothetical protein